VSDGAAPYDRGMSRAPSPRLPVLAQDAALALFVTLMQIQGVPQVAANSDVVARPLADLGHLGTFLLVASGLVLVVRRRWPVAVFAFTAAASVLYFALEFPDGPGWLALLVAIYTVTAHGDGRRSLVVAGVGIGLLAVAWLVAAQDVEPREALGWVFFRIGASVMSAALGESARSRRVIAAEAEERAELAERTREEEARARVDAERLRIAREVHDTVAHSIAIINIQAGVTAHVLDKRPEQARATLEAIEQTSSQALQEMRAILGVLRDSDDPREPHPGLAQVDELAATARDAGLELTLVSPDPDGPVPSAVGSAAYRILQESITNVLRHAGPTRVRVALAYDDDVLEVSVVDDGRVPAPVGGGTTHPPRAPAPATGTGRGIVGMRERCRLLGGDLRAGPRPGGGFEVRARLPLEPAARVER
jgi:signal transduction histidine kinase